MDATDRSRASEEDIQTDPVEGVRKDYSQPAPQEIKDAEKTEITTIKTDVAVLEAGKARWEGFENDIIDDKMVAPVRGIRYIILSFYRRLFTIVFTINIGIFIAACVKKGAQLSPEHLALVALGNLFVATIMRWEHTVNAIYHVCINLPRSWPFIIRRTAAKVYAIGGIHSGSAISGTVWLILFLGQATKEFVHSGRISVATLTVSYVILALFIVMIFFAYPDIRSRTHNSFEHTHRFMGWTAIALLWVQIVLLTKDTKAAEIPLGKALLKNPAIWLATVMTFSITTSWWSLRKVPINVEVLSKHAVRVYFDYTTPERGTYNRISVAPLTEWHSFATILEPGNPGGSIVISRAGDWTSRFIDNPPKKVWKRGVPVCGVMCIVPLFRRLVVVATGSGIGPVAPPVIAQKVPIRLLWTARDVRGTFGDKLVDQILAANPESVIYDTRTHGKPDMVKLTLRLVKEFNAEAVIIISNKELTDKVTYGCSARGIPAFGAVWDS